MARKPPKAAGAEAAPVEARLALDRFILGLWTERDLAAFLTGPAKAAAPLAPLSGATALDRPRRAEELRTRLFGAARPTGMEELEALVRQGVDCVFAGVPVLTELQHDLQAKADAVPRGDPRAQAVRALSDYACASQVNVAVQEVGKLAEATTDRVAKARSEALRKLTELLAPFPYLMPLA